MRGSKAYKYGKDVGYQGIGFVNADINQTGEKARTSGWEIGTAGATILRIPLSPSACRKQSICFYFIPRNISNIFSYKDNLFLGCKFVKILGLQVKK